MSSAEANMPQNLAQLEHLQREYARKILLRLYAELGHTARLAVGREIRYLDHPPQGPSHE